MKKLATLAFTAALAVAATATTATTANAHHYDHYRGYGPAAGAGVGLGLEIDFRMRLGVFAGVGAWHGPHGHYYHGRSWRDHVRYCYSRYRSYNAHTNTFVGYDGRRRYCR